MPNLIMLVGPSGAGKSTLANLICQDLNTFYINQDTQGDIRHLELFKEAVAAKKSICVDRMGFSKKQRAHYLNPAKKAGYTTKIIVLHENRETCFNRIINRYDHATIPHNDRDTANKVLDFFFKSYERPTLDEADEVEFKYPTPKLKLKALVCDIDNTLSSADHREFHLSKENGRKPNWKAFFDAMGEDPLNEWCKDLIKRYREDHIIILNSGRPDSYRKVTEEWLAKHNVPYDHLFMRHRQDSRKDDLVKELLMDFEIKTRVNSISLWVDDRAQVIQKIRSRGILVLDCKGNTF